MIDADRLESVPLILVGWAGNGVGMRQRAESLSPPTEPAYTLARGLGSPRRPFSWDVRQKLCEHLLALPEMTTQDQRDLVIDQVARDFPGLLSVGRQPAPHSDMLEFVTAAYDHPGALRRMLQVLSYLYLQDVRLSQIEHLIGTVEPDDLLTQAERRAVLGELESIESKLFAAAFHVSTHTTIVEAGFRLSDVAHIVARVESFPASAGRLPPLFDFIDYIAHRSPRSARARLHEWMDQVSHRLGSANRSAVDAVCRDTENRLVRSGRYYLVTEVTPDHGAPGHFFLAAWRQHEDEPEEVIYADDRSVSLARASETIYGLMKELARTVEDAAPELVLEVILPRALVTKAIDQWSVDSVLPSPIGTVYPLVLRSFDRLDDASMHSDWARNWEWIKENGRSTARTAIHEIASHDPASSQALRAALLHDGPPVAVLMLRSLSNSESLAPDAYTAGIRGGAPILIWSRDDASSAELANWVRDTNDGDLLDLPERVFQLRLQTLQPGATVLGTTVAVVYDDYDRLPEKYRGRSRLRSPKYQKQRQS